VDAGGAVSAAADSGLSAALLQISQHAERIAVLDGRESGHFRDVSETLGRLDASVTGLKGAVADQGTVLASLDGLGEDVATLAAQVASLLPPAPGPGYRPIPAVQWWAIEDEERQKAVARLRDWVTRIYRPHYGHLAAMLADCWEAHPLCLVQLDWASELWSVLYLQRTRNARDLAAQAEFGTRILPAVSEQLGAETSRCHHRRAPAAANGWAGTR
jgi:hypothetical protein